MYTYDDYYEDEVINESALDMAVDMSDRYGIAVEDAYTFACDAMEGSLKDPRKRDLREKGRTEIAKQAYFGTKPDTDYDPRYLFGAGPKQKFHGRMGADLARANWREYRKDYNDKAEAEHARARAEAIALVRKCARTRKPE